ncbi:MAG: CPBP family intramembrane metalloprotease [Chlamydiales bacterium]|nr:CPBP family intramembrane metalloprotease [Chlamydiales bacterium]
MKTLIVLLCMTSFLHAASPEEDAKSIAPAAIESQEIASLEIMPLLQQQSSLSLDILPPLPPAKKAPWVAATLGFFPGLGHVYLEDPITAGALLGTAGGGMILAESIKKNESLLNAVDATTMASIWYSPYAAYRDARLMNGSSHYSYQMPTDSLMDLTLAPFRWEIIKKPEVWGGVLGCLTAATLIGTLASNVSLSACRASTGLDTFCALPVGVGEEAFFRGYLQSAISEVSNPVAGTILSSILFGAAHFPNGGSLSNDGAWRFHAFILPLITGIGAYCGWLTHKTHSLQASVALHTWYDFIIFLGRSLAKERAAITTPKTFSFSTAF